MASFDSRAFDTNAFSILAFFFGSSTPSPVERNKDTAVFASVSLGSPLVASCCISGNSGVSVCMGEIIGATGKMAGISSQSVTINGS